MSAERPPRQATRAALSPRWPESRGGESTTVPGNYFWKARRELMGPLLVARWLRVSCNLTHPAWFPLSRVWVLSCSFIHNFPFSSLRVLTHNKDGFLSPAIPAFHFSLSYTEDGRCPHLPANTHTAASLPPGPFHPHIRRQPAFFHLPLYTCAFSHAHVHTHTHNGNYVEMIDTIINWNVVIISKSICISKHLVVHFKCIQFYMLISQ